jgi:hypothetical protein
MLGSTACDAYAENAGINRGVMQLRLDSSGL